MSLKRRTFLKKSALASGAAVLPNLTAKSKAKTIDFHIPADFSIQILATNWGFKGNFEQFCIKAKESEYDGVEFWVPQEKAQQDHVRSMTEKHGLKYGFLAAGSGNEFEQHFKTFKESVAKATSLKPLFVNCHSGRDFFTFEQNRRIIEFTVEHTEKTGVPVYHETHRARILFNAMLTRQFIELIPGLRLTLDISHWTNVHASLLDEQAETVDIALGRTSHVHSRVGHTNGPQIGDPRAPEWTKEMEQHFKWWDKVVQRSIKEGHTLTMTTEFGPPNYMPALPYTRQPIVDLWEVNSHMKDLWRERYQSNE